MTMPQNDLNNCKFVKSILMLLVILGHSVSFWTGGWFSGGGSPAYESDFLSVLAEWLGSFHIYAFALTSGYIYYYAKIERGGYEQFGSFIINKTKRLIVPYIFVAAVWVMPLSNVFNHYSIHEILKSYVLGLSPAQLWFLLMIFDVFVIAWVLTNIMTRNWIGILISVVLYGVGIIGGIAIPNVIRVLTACQYFIFFFVGFKLRQNSFDKLKRIPWYLYIMLYSLLFCLMKYFSNIGYIKYLMEFLTHMTGAIMAFVVLQKLASSKNQSVKSINDYITKHISKYSMSMYLFHQQIIYFTIYWLNGKVNPYIHAGINFVVALVGSFLISSILMTWKVTRFLIGEKP